MDVRIGKFKVSDGLSLHYQQWSPDSIKGGIVFVHGVGDHCGRYASFVRYFTAKGYKVCLYDQRGHGKSPGRRVHVKHFQSYSDDLKCYVDFCLQNGLQEFPWFLVGHSLGGQVVVNFLAQHPNLFRAACTASPNLEIAFPIPPWKKILASILLALFPILNLKGYTDPNFLSHNQAVVHNYRSDPMVYPYMTIRLAKEIYNNLENLPSLYPKIQTPLLMLHGSHDQYCLPSGTVKFFHELLLAQKQLKIYEGLYHELFNETKKEEIFSDLERWFDRFFSNAHP